jgi:hypothetical protein
MGLAVFIVSLILCCHSSGFTKAPKKKMEKNIIAIQIIGEITSSYPSDHLFEKNWASGKERSSLLDFAG